MTLDLGHSTERVGAVALNALDPSAVDKLDSDTRALVERRRAVMGPGYRLAYAEPLRPARALGTKIIDVNGVEYLDAYNNVPGIGHSHPRVTEAITRQLSLVNTNTRYLQGDIVDYAENLVATHGPAITNVVLTCTGSEANDLAVRAARFITGGVGVIVTSFAYHGNTTEVDSWSPASGSGVLGEKVRLVPPPDSFRVPQQRSEIFAANVQAQIDDLQQSGVPFAALIIDSLFSSDGIFPDALDLSLAVDVVHRAGGVVIADEVQSGFGRTGSNMWGYQRFNFDADIATMGKAMGNAIPIAGLVMKRDIAERFGAAMPYFNTFAAHNIPVAAAQAVLDVISEESLLDNCVTRGDQLTDGIREALAQTGHRYDVRSAGLYIGVEFVLDFEAKLPDQSTADKICNSLRQRRVLVSCAGPYANVLKIRPPLVFSEADVDRFLTEFNAVVREVPPAGSS
jgi:acetylornithine aminotransferase